LAPRKKSVAELIASGARAGRIAARKAEEYPLKAYITAWNLENETFAARCIPGERITRNLDGSVFDWASDHYLTVCRNFAREALNGEKPGMSRAEKNQTGGAEKN